MNSNHSQKMANTDQTKMATQDKEVDKKFWRKVNQNCGDSEKGKIRRMKEQTEMYTMYRTVFELKLCACHATAMLWWCLCYGGG